MACVISDGVIVLACAKIRSHARCLALDARVCTKQGGPSKPAVLFTIYKSCSWVVGRAAPGHWHRRAADRAMGRCRTHGPLRAAPCPRCWPQRGAWRLDACTTVCCLGRRRTLTNARRISKYLAFVPLQDATGVVQLVLHAGDEAAEQAKLDTLCQVPLESVLNIRGHVSQRAQGAENPVRGPFVSMWALLTEKEYAYGPNRGPGSGLAGPKPRTGLPSLLPLTMSLRPGMWRHLCNLAPVLTHGPAQGESASQAPIP